MTVHPLVINESPSLSTMDEAALRTQTVGRGEGDGEAITDDETEGEAATDFVGDGDEDDDAIRLRDSDTERLSDLVMEGDRFPIVPAKL